MMMNDMPQSAHIDAPYVSLANAVRGLAERSERAAQQLQQVRDSLLPARGEGHDGAKAGQAHQGTVQEYVQDAHASLSTIEFLLEELLGEVVISAQPAESVAEALAALSGHIAMQQGSQWPGPRQY